MKKLSVIIVSYNVKYYVEQCIVSVQRAAKDIDYEIYVVDNRSRDGTVNYLTRRFGSAITLIESPHNLGFARANNMAIRQTDSEYVLLLNPDTFIAEDCLTEVLAFMDSHPNAGGAGVMMHNSDGSRARESRRGLPTPWVSLLKMTGFSERYYLSHLPWDTPGRIEVVSGAFCMLRRVVLDKVGLLDETFFMYGEDIDLSFRILKGGFENWYIPARIVHYKGESTQKTSYRYVHVFYQAMLIFFRKHYGHLSLLITLPIQLAIYFRAFIALVQMQYQRMSFLLGFSYKDASYTRYLFVGSPAMQEECRVLARRKGLLATYAEEPPRQADCDCVVFDTDHFTFQQIIDCASGFSGDRPLIGTYSSNNKTIITLHEIIK